MTDTVKEPSDTLQGNILKALNKTPFFEHFTLYEKKRLAASHTSFVKFTPGASIIREGELESCFYVLLSGSVSIMKQDVELNSQGAGDFFGEMAFLANTVRTSSVVAQELSFALRIDQELMAQLSCDIREKIKEQCIFKLVERVDKLTERLRARM